MVLRALPAPSEASAVPPRLADPHRFEIRIQGQLDAGWSDWFDGFELTECRDGTTILTGPVTDQAALHGILRRIGDVGLTLLSVNPTPSRP